MPALKQPNHFLHLAFTCVHILMITTCYSSNLQVEWRVFPQIWATNSTPDLMLN